MDVPSRILRASARLYCEGLATFPTRGRGRDDILAGLRITNYRRRAVNAFLVDAEAQIVSIVGVYYGGRDFEAILRGAPKMIARRISKTARLIYGRPLHYQPGHCV